MPKQRHVPYSPPPGSTWLVAVGTLAKYEFIEVSGVVAVGNMLQQNLAAGGIAEHLSARIQGAICVPATSQIAPTVGEGWLNLGILEGQQELNHTHPPCGAAGSSNVGDALAIFVFANSEPQMTPDNAKQRITHGIDQRRWKAKGLIKRIVPWTG